MRRISQLFISAMILATGGFMAGCGDAAANTEPRNMDSSKSSGVSINRQATVFTVKNVSFKMIPVKGGTFMMGADDRERDQKPAHSVTLSDYMIGETEVTQELWRAVMGSNPSEFSGRNLPVDNVTWRACHEFVKRLNAMLHESGQLAPDRNFHLPSEAQWEFAARGGTQSKGYAYAGSDDIDAVAWTRGNTNRTHPVASKKPNELGLYDMSGNVWEWVEDYYFPYSSEAQTDPCNTAKRDSQNRVIKRGGSWYYSQRERFTPTYRYGYYTDVTDSSIGVRLCL